MIMGRGTSLSPRKQKSYNVEKYSCNVLPPEEGKMQKKVKNTLLHSVPVGIVCSYCEGQRCQYMKDLIIKVDVLGMLQC